MRCFFAPAVLLYDAKGDLTVSDLLQARRSSSSDQFTSTSKQLVVYITRIESLEWRCLSLFWL